MKAFIDLADVTEKGWGVPVLPVWKDKIDEDKLEYFRGLAEEERSKRVF